MISELEKQGVFKYLKKRFYHCICKSIQQYRYFDNFDNLKFVELPVRILKNNCGISQYRQSKILDELILENKLIVKLGKSRKRYFTICESEVEE